MVIITASDVAPSLTSVGMVYGRYEGELKKLLTDLTYVSNPAFVWVRSITKNSTSGSRICIIRRVIVAIKSALGRQLGTQFDSVFDVVKSNPMYDKSGGKIPSTGFKFC